MDGDLGGDDQAAKVEQLQALGLIVPPHTFPRFLALSCKVQSINWEHAIRQSQALLTTTEGLGHFHNHDNRKLKVDEELLAQQVSRLLQSGEMRLILGLDEQTTAAHGSRDN